MRGRFLLLLILCGVLLLLQALPQEAVQAMASGEYLIYIDLSTMSLTLYRGRDEVGALGQLPLALGKTPDAAWRFSGLTEGSARSRPGFGHPVSGLIRAMGGSMVFMVRNKPGVDWQPCIATVASGCTPAMPKKLYSLVSKRGRSSSSRKDRTVSLDGDFRRLPRVIEGSLVCAAQRKLRALGYYSGSLDGIYGDGMSAAVTQFFARIMAFPAKDGIDAQAWEALGVVLFE